jgi:hypothetical protein
MLSILSIDIGIKNLSLCKEYYDIDLAKNIQIVEKKDRYTKDLICTDKYKSYINEIFKCGVVKMMDKKDITHGIPFKYIDNKILINLIDYLDDLNKKGYFNDIDIILIEKQLKKNFIACTIQNHLHNYFIMLYRDSKNIITYPSKNKTRILGAPLKTIDNKTNKIRKIKKYERKKWSCEQADQLLHLRNDQLTLNYIFNLNKNKKDDLSDILIQTLSYILLYMDTTLNKKNIISI